MTFYLYKIPNLRDSIATLPGFTIDEAMEVIDNQYKSSDVIPLTADEVKLLRKAIDKDPRSDDYISEEVVYDALDSLKDKFYYGKYLSGSENTKTSYSFWICGAFDTYSSVYAVGADTVGSYEFNLNSIAKKLGQRSFYEFSIYKGKRVKDVSTLLKLMQDHGYRGKDITEDQLIDLFNQDKYMIFRN